MSNFADHLSPEGHARLNVTETEIYGYDVDPDTGVVYVVYQADFATWSQENLSSATHLYEDEHGRVYLEFASNVDFTVFRLNYSPDESE